MVTKIISAFPGTGKSYYYKNHKDSCLDSDSSTFDKADFPANYIRHIEENIGKYEFIFVSSHKVVRDALRENCLFFYLVYPEFNNKHTYLKRYKNRGSSEDFIKLLDRNWEKWIAECLHCREGCKSISMVYDYISEELERLW